MVERKRERKHPEWDNINKGEKREKVFAVAFEFVGVKNEVREVF